MPNSAVLSDARLITLCEIVVVALLAVQLALLGWRLVQPQGPVGAACRRAAMDVLSRLLERPVVGPIIERMRHRLIS